MTNIDVEFAKKTGSDVPEYQRRIEELLSHYVEGKNVFIKPKDWNEPLLIKPESVDQEIPTEWLGLVEEVSGIIAKYKYGLDTYPNEIRKVDSEQMLALYASVGLPRMYSHWSFGKSLDASQKSYDAGQMGLAYEIVINSSPCISYCMTQNTKMMQILVINHAAFGHNSFFKGNHLFRQFTKAEEILPEIERISKYVAECEQRYGKDVVTSVLDAAHALQIHGVDKTTRPRKRTAEEEKARREEIEEFLRTTYNPVMSSAGQARRPRSEFQKGAHPYEDLEGEENLLYLIATRAPHLEEWKRKLILDISYVAQYFYPQRQTQVMNEGWASFWHYTLTSDMYDLDLISDGMYLEFLQSHANVLYQAPMDARHYSGINPYKLGFEIYSDIKRISENPTEEDREWFPAFAGKGNWLEVIKEAMQNYRDDDFVQQFLSPRLIREMDFCTVEDNEGSDSYVIAEVGDQKGYHKIRADLAEQYCLANKIPCITAEKYFLRKDRTLELEHRIYNGKPLHDSSVEKVMKYIYSLWGHPVVLHSVLGDGADKETISTMGCPKIPKYIDRGHVFKEVALG
ncbi:MAG: SpoVR family protein [Pseudobdellovibrionaceae bacterium]|jgi:spore cortex formation protein SpoVR/YcgB (stage V sporulation)|nr:SpoVR family protein [Pseudobdellovibrionaceae bacterium]